MKLSLQKIRQHGGDIASFEFDAPTQLSWQPGQYAHWRFAEDDEQLARWFTIASAPSSGRATITTSLASGSRFKRRLSALEPGDTIDLSSVGGSIIWENEPQPLLFVAQGLGITPYIAMLSERHHQQQSIDATLLYVGNHHLHDSNFTTFDQNNSSFSYLPLTSMSQLTDQLAKIKDLPERLVYLTGSQSFVDTHKQWLINHGVPRWRLRDDGFLD